jgi:hypothetical protein
MAIAKEELLVAIYKCKRKKTKENEQNNAKYIRVDTGGSRCSAIQCVRRTVACRAHTVFC